MSDHLNTGLAVLAGSAWLVPAVFLLCALDGVVPVVPGEAAAITAGALAVTGRPNLVAVILAAALGSLLGDCLCYAIWRRLQSAMAARACSGTRRGAALDWAGDLLFRRGGSVILLARFIPSGRTAATVAAATTGLPFRRYLPWDAAAAGSWAVYITLLGYLGGHATGGNPLHGLLVGLGVAALATAVPALVRQYRARRRRPVVDIPTPESPASPESGQSWRGFDRTITCVALHDTPQTGTLNG